MNGAGKYSWKINMKSSKIIILRERKISLNKRTKRRTGRRKRNTRRLKGSRKRKRRTGRMKGRRERRRGSLLEVCDSIGECLLIPIIYE